MGMAHQWKAPRQTENTITPIARGENLRPQPIDVAGGHVTLAIGLRDYIIAGASVMRGMESIGVLGNTLRWFSLVTLCSSSLTLCSS